MLKHFREIEQRRLWIHVSSLYEFLSRTFKLTNDQVYPRLQAMRLMNDVPEVEDKLVAGDLSITNLLKAQQIFNSESKKRRIDVTEKRSLLSALEKTSTRQAEKIMATIYPISHRPPEKIKPISENQNLVQFYVDDETLAEIEKLKERYSHQMPGGRMQDLLKILIRMANRQLETRERTTEKSKSDTQSPRNANSDKPLVTDIAPPKTVSRSRYISAKIKRKMDETRFHGCAHVDPVGHRCGSKYFLQLDHIKEFSRGGSNEAENLRWLCAFHNQNRCETERRGGAENRGTAEVDSEVTIRFATTSQREILAVRSFRNQTDYEGIMGF